MHVCCAVRIEMWVDVVIYSIERPSMSKCNVRVQPKSIKMHLIPESVCQKPIKEADRIAQNKETTDEEQRFFF